MSSNKKVSSSLDLTCLKHRKWYWFIMSSMVVFIGGLIIISTYNLVERLLSKVRHRRAKQLKRGISLEESEKRKMDEIEKASLASFSCSIQPPPKKRHGSSGGGGDDVWSINVSIKMWASQIVSGQTKTGQIMIILVLFVSLASLGIFIYDSYTSSVESCGNWSHKLSWQVDLAFNVFFLAYFILQFIAAHDKMMFWLDLFSIIDFFTIPPCFVTLLINRSWIGLRFLRVLRIMSFPDVLQFLNLLKSTTSTRLCQLIFTFMSVWLTGAGFIYLLENTGDPFYNYENSQALTFWECIYFVLVTMSTVGYGDIVCRTLLGQIFNMVFLLGGLAMFASFVPEIAEILSERSKYREPYRGEHDRRHVVLFGHITADSVGTFISDFLHPEREDAEVDVVIMNMKEPDLDMQRLLKRYYNQLFYIQGNVMTSDDLNRAALRKADACLILADKYSGDMDAEDASNIMRVISVKNYASNVKVIIQLLQYQSKTYLMNIPTWDWMRGDDCICLSELKLGFIAQSCMAPGFSTLMANLFAMRSYHKTEIEDNGWLQTYKRGTGMEIYCVELSQYFIGMTFSEAAEFCYTELKILLLAVDTSKNKAESRSIVMNPASSVTIEPNTMGFFIAQSHKDVKIASFYCKYCYPEFKYTNTFCQAFCDCMVQKHRDPSCVCEVNKLFHLSSYDQQESVEAVKTIMKVEKVSGAEEDCQFDITGMFHWCPERFFEDCIMSKDEAANLSSHIVVCLFADPTSPLVGLQNFVMPLRASNFHYEELRPVLIIGDLDYLNREWKFLCNYPKIFVFPGSPLNRTLLRTVNINLSHCCVVMSAKKSCSEIGTLMDKEAILCSLNVRAMLFGSQTPKNFLALSNRMRKQSKAGGASTGSDITMITELENDTNIQYVEQDIGDILVDETYLSPPFACGTAFTASVLDSLMSSAYFSKNSVKLIRSLITGGSTPELEQILAEGMTPESGEVTADMINSRKRCRVAQFSLADRYFSKFINKTYEELFVNLLKNYDTLCIGLYRICEAMQMAGLRRYVITNPPNDFLLSKYDKCFCLSPGNVYPNPFSGQFNSGV